MSPYLIHVLNAPSVATVDDAFAFIERPAPSAPGEAWRMTQFMATLFQRHPVTASEFQPGVWTPSLWIENPLDAEPDTTLVSLPLPLEKARHHQYIGEIAVLATSVGMQVLDPQDAVLYRTDGVGVGRHGPVKTVCGENLPLNETYMPVRVIARLAEGLKDHGWSLSHFSGPRPSLSRVLGPCDEVRQTLVMMTQRSDEGHPRLTFSVVLSTARVSFMWQSLFGAYIHGAVTGGGQLWPDFELFPCAFDQALFPAPPSNPVSIEIKSAEDEIAWVEQVDHWYSSGLGARLDQVSNLRALAEVVFDPRRRAAPSELFATPSRAMSALVLSRVVQSPQFEGLANAIMMRFHEEHYWTWMSRLHDPVGWHLEALVKHLKSPDFRFDLDHPHWTWPVAEPALTS